jgi:hypothetical protein
MRANVRPSAFGVLPGPVATAGTVQAVELSGKRSSSKESKSVFAFDQHGDQFTG